LNPLRKFPAYETGNESVKIWANALGRTARS
jgi:hypothetical protein